jgi:hypothetical protein
MKIFMTGSIIGHKPGTDQMPKEQDAPLFKAAEDIGYEAALTGHDILVRNVESCNVIDQYVLQGVTNFCTEHSTKNPTVELHLPEFFQLNKVHHYSNINIKIFRHPGHSGSSTHDYHRDYFEFLSLTVRAVERCDIAVTMGDGESVRIVGSLAASGKVPVVAIATFGGSSKEVFEQNRNVYSSRFEDSHTYSVLIDRWDQYSAKKVINIADMLNASANNGKNHKYFISYSHKDAIIADQVELLLRRKNRRVLRDEVILQVGEQFPDMIAALIGECDTFLAIGSKNYIASEWCKRELTFAVDKIKPNRIVYLDTDGSGFPIQVSDKLGILASSRDTRHSAIERIISEEKCRGARLSI